MPHGCRYPQMPKEDVESPGDGATGSSEPPYVGIGNLERGFFNQFCYTNICI